MEYFTLEELLKVVKNDRIIKKSFLFSLVAYLNNDKELEILLYWNDGQKRILVIEKIKDIPFVNYFIQTLVNENKKGA